MSGSVNLLGTRIDRLTMDETVARCAEVIRQDGHVQHVVVNAAKMVSLRDDPQLRRIVADCEIVNADGQSIVWASRLLGEPLPERVAGIDLMDRLLALAAAEGFPVYFLGARQEVLEEAVRRLCETYPGLPIAGYRNGYFGPEEDAEVCEAINRSGAKLLFVAMSSPKKELWLAEHRSTLRVPFMMGVGGALDVAAGLTRRAPKSMQKLGLEWAYRLMQEPRRLFSRYVRTNARFTWLVVRSWIGRRRGVVQ